MINGTGCFFGFFGGLGSKAESRFFSFKLDANGCLIGDRSCIFSFSLDANGRSVKHKRDNIAQKRNCTPIKNTKFKKLCTNLTAGICSLLFSLGCRCSLGPFKILSFRRIDLRPQGVENISTKSSLKRAFFQFLLRPIIPPIIPK